MTLAKLIGQTVREAQTLASELRQLIISTAEQSLLIADELLECHYDVVRYSDNWYQTKIEREEMLRAKEGITRWFARLQYPNEVEMITLGIFPHGQGRYFEAVYLSFRPSINGIEVRFALLEDPISFSIETWNQENFSASQERLRKFIELGLLGVIERQKSDYTLARLAFATHSVIKVPFAIIPNEYELGKSVHKAAQDPAAKQDAERMRSLQDLCSAIQRTVGPLEEKLDEDKENK